MQKVPSYIPGFIHDQYESGNFHGQFSGSALHLDLSGFTMITEQLMEHGKEGAEILSAYLDKVFGEFIKAIYTHDGFVSGFAGDAITALFNKSNNVLSACRAALQIQISSSNNPDYPTKFGELKLSARIGLAFGNIEWGILGSDDLKVYFFRGPAMDKCIRAEQFSTSGKIVIESSLKKQLPLSFGEIEELEKGMFLLVKSDCVPVQSFLRPQVLNRDIVEQFLPRTLLLNPQKGEFRNVVSLFLSFNEVGDYEKLNAFVKTVVVEVNNHGGFIESLDFGDKGAMFLIIFGFPIARENMINSAITCIHSIRDLFGLKIKAGLAFGTVFAGIKGSLERASFGILGDTVNLAARFVQKADWGEIWISKYLADKVGDSYFTSDKGELSFKGKSEKVKVCLLKERREAGLLNEMSGPMVGRVRELRETVEIIDTIFHRRSFSWINIYGEAGIGKSRFVYEIIRSVKNRMNVSIFSADSTIKKNLAPFTMFFKQEFRLAENVSKDRQLIHFNQSFQTMVNDLRNEKTEISDPRFDDLLSELIRTKSILAALVEIEEADSLYDTMEPQDRPDALKHAIITYFQINCLIQPLLLVCEDVQWYDAESLDILNKVEVDCLKFPMQVLATSRSDSAEPMVKGRSSSRHYNLVLDELEKDELTLLVSSILGTEADKNLLRYLHTKSNGNPFYLEQLCHFLHENHLLEQNRHELSLSGSVEDIPLDLQHLIMARIDRFSHQLKEVLQIASILGRQFEVILLEQIINLASKIPSVESGYSNVNEPKPIIQQGISENILSAVSELAYIFKHALLRDAIYDMQLRARLRTLHKLAGDSIILLYKDNEAKCADAAYHYELAEEEELTYQYYLRAAHFAKGNFHIEQAHYCYEKAVHFCKKLFGDNHMNVGSVLCQYAEFTLMTNEYDLAEELFDSALDIYNKVKDDHCEEIVELLNGKGTTFVYSGKNKKAMDCLEEALNLYQSEHSEESDLLALLINNIGMAHHYSGNIEQAEQYFQRALDMRNRSCEEVHLDTVMCLNNVGYILSSKGKYTEALERYNKALQIIDTLGCIRRSDAIVTLYNKGRVYHQMGKYHQAIDIYLQAKKIIVETYGQNHLNNATIDSYLLTTYIAMEKYDVALTCLKNVLALRIKKLGKDNPETMTTINDFGFYLYCTNQHQKALSCHRSLLQRRIQFHGHEHPYVALSYNNLALAQQACDRYDEALQSFQKSLTIRTKILGDEHTQTTYTCYNLGNLLFLRGDLDEALFYFNKARNSANLDIHEINMRIPRVFYFIAHIYLYKKDYEESLDSIEKALESLKEGDNYLNRSDLLSMKALAFFNAGRVTEALKIIQPLTTNLVDLNVKVSSRLYCTLGSIVASTKRNEEISILKKISEKTGCGLDPEKYFERAIQQTKSSNYKIEYLDSLIELGKYLYTVGKISDAKQTFHTAYTFARDKSMKFYSRSIAEYISQTEN